MGIAKIPENLEKMRGDEMSLQRYEQERRQKRAHPWLNIHCLRGRRRQHRRVADMHNPALSLDWHQSHFLYITLATLFLSFADAHNTLQLLWKGALEANLLMDFLIHKSTFSSKMLTLETAYHVI